ncbi:MAG: PH domain-containing protein [Clostridium sp.]|uniref:PH domain-containing protein n=1 Tax=Clostridium sp. DSM 8431 TaxID=1761781 RepID=UPI0008E03726|nr:PH domain-containing protein [Clostridium sp. DSM 8431]MCR4944198.1 PH domain-containing protein [Clostridium sp.]SFU44948.1 PH domain-containing protein [Clostridium sp. DSM 8431]
MGLYDKLTGKATAGADLKFVQDFFSENETVLSSYQFIRDSIVLTNLGIYLVDVQGVTGKKVEVKFFPAKNVKSVSFETAGNFDLDVDVKIGVDGNTVMGPQGAYYSAPISFKVPSKQAAQAKEIVSQVKKYYLCV